MQKNEGANELPESQFFGSKETELPIHIAMEAISLQKIGVKLLGLDFKFQ